MQNNISFTTRSPLPDDLDLGPNQVDIWRVFLTVQPDSLQQMESTLSADESQRASRFHFEEDRARYIVAHASLRKILARYLRCKPHDVKFSTNEYGKPFLIYSDDSAKRPCGVSRLDKPATKVASTKKIEFNLSHSGAYALMAVTRARKVGIDIEIIRQDFELENLARRYFSPREISEWMALPPEQQTLGFFKCWTRKEAYIKAQGLGLSLPLDSFDVSLGEPALLRATRHNPSEASLWRMLSLDVHSDYAGAVAVQGNKLDFKFWDWNQG